MIYTSIIGSGLSRKTMDIKESFAITNREIPILTHHTGSAMFAIEYESETLFTQDGTMS